MNSEPSITSLPSSALRNWARKYTIFSPLRDLAAGIAVPLFSVFTMCLANAPTSPTTAGVGLTEFALAGYACFGRRVRTIAALGLAAGLWIATTDQVQVFRRTAIADTTDQALLAAREAKDGKVAIKVPYLGEQVVVQSKSKSLPCGEVTVLNQDGAPTAPPKLQCWAREKTTMRPLWYNLVYKSQPS